MAAKDIFAKAFKQPIDPNIQKKLGKPTTTDPESALKVIDQIEKDNAVPAPAKPSDHPSSGHGK